MPKRSFSEAQNKKSPEKQQQESPNSSLPSLASAWPLPLTAPWLRTSHAPAGARRNRRLEGRSPVGGSKHKYKKVLISRDFKRKLPQKYVYIGSKI